MLGDVKLCDSAGAEVRLSPQRVHILAVLAAAAGSVVPRSSMLEDLWGEDSDASRHRLKTLVTQIRHKLGTDLSVDSHLGGYRLRGSLEQVDSTLFESLVTTARQLDRQHAASQYDRALRLWSGPAAFLSVDSLLVDEARWRLENLRTATVLNLADCEIELLKPGYSLELLQPIFDDDPTRGDVTLRLANLLALCGRQIESLRAIGRHRDALQGIGLSPDAAVVDLEGRILRHDLEGSLSSVPMISQSRAEGFHSAGGLIRRTALERHVADELTRGSVILWGEAGVGKTLLTLAVAQRLESLGLAVIRVSARPDPTRPMETMSDIVEQFGLLCSAKLREYLQHPGTAAAVARLSGDRTTKAPAITREQLISELTSLVLAIVANGGATLIVEDAHWMDNSSAEIVGHLIEQRTPYLLMTTRKSLADDFGATWNDAPMIEVPPFSVAEVRELVDLRLPVRASDDLAEELHQTSGGNGLFLRLKLDLLADGQLGRDLPPTIIHAVHERTSRFSEKTRDVLQTAALLGQTFPVAALARVHPHFREALRDAVEERLVRVDIESACGEFVHGLVVDAFIKTFINVTSPAARVARHDQLCRALMALGESPSVVAKHAVRSVRLDTVRVVFSCLAAARQQAQLFEWKRTIRWARLGLAAHKRCGIDDPRTEAELRTLVGKGLRRLNLSGSSTELGRASDLAYALGDHEMFVSCVTELCLHGPTTQAGTVDAGARLQLDRALVAPVAALQRAELLSAAATLLAVSEESDLGRTLYRQALDIAEAAADPVTLRTIRMNAHLGLSHPEDTDARRRAAAGLLTLDDHEAQWEGSFLQFGLALIDANRQQLEDSIEGMRRLTSAVKQRNQQRALQQVEAVFAFIRGDLDDATRLAERSFHMSLESYPMSWATTIYAALVVPIREAQGRVAELLPEIAGLLESSPTFITWHAVAACVGYAAGDESLMARELSYLADHDFQFVKDLSWTAVATIVCRPIWAAHDATSAAVVYGRVLPYSGLMTWNGLSTHGPVDAGLACLADVLGDSGAVARHLQTSRTLVDRLGAPHLFWPELSSLSGST